MTFRTSVKVIKQKVIGNEINPTEEDNLAIEDPLEIVLRYNGENTDWMERTLSLTMRTPGKDSEMITGHLFCEGIIRQPVDIDSILYNEPVAMEAPTRAVVRLRKDLIISQRAFERNNAVFSSCGVCGKTSSENLSLPGSLKISDDITVAAEWIHTLPGLMNQQQEGFRKTGGLHAAAIFSSEGHLLASNEDIGRHNALDKAIGENLINGHFPGHGQVLCVSGRMSYEILQKALMARIPIITGIGAPSSLAVSLANDFNVTLIGFVRNNSYNIYSCPERLHTR